MRCSTAVDNLAKPLHQLVGQPWPDAFALRQSWFKALAVSFSGASLFTQMAAHSRHASLLSISDLRRYFTFLSM